MDEGGFQLPIIDLGNPNKNSISHQIITASQEYGFFKIINHGVPHHIVTRMEQEARQFFTKPATDKHRAGPAKPYGYGCKTIGLNGDTGHLEYLLLQPNSHVSPYVSNDDNHDNFRCAVKGYVEAVKDLACEILDYMESGLVLGLGYQLKESEQAGNALPNSKMKMMSGLMKDPENDSVFRLNHYPVSSMSYSYTSRSNGHDGIDDNSNNNVGVGDVIGFGEHTDPQLLTILRSNAVDGLQISLEEGVWLPVNPYPTSAFCVNVGDALQVMSNGRFKSVKHRAVVVKSCSPKESRLSMAYFCAPPLEATVCCLPGISGRSRNASPPLYRSFSWAEYKAATYAGRLGDDRLNNFRLLNVDAASS